MKGSRLRALAAAVVLTFVCAGVAVAANTGGFADPNSDSGSAPDVTSVAISNDDAGIVTVKLTLANRGQVTSNDTFAVGLDTDQNPDTGTVFYGAEYELDLDRGAVQLWRDNGNGLYAQGPVPSSVQISFSGGVVTFSFKASELGITSGFNLYAFTADANRIDVAPDIRMVNHQLVAGTAAPVLGRDTRAPFTQAIKSSGVHGKITDINYYAADGRGETSDAIVVYRGKKIVRRVTFPIADTNSFLTYSARWKVPKKTKGKFRFCVTSTDRAGNRSRTSCAALTIR